MLTRQGNAIVLEESGLEVTLLSLCLPFRVPPSLAFYLSAGTPVSSPKHPPLPCHFQLQDVPLAAGCFLGQLLARVFPPPGSISLPGAQPPCLVTACQSNVLLSFASVKEVLCCIENSQNII